MQQGSGLVLNLNTTEDIIISHEQEIIKLQFFIDSHGRKKIRIICDKNKFDIHRIERRQAVYTVERER